jgi:hypothetical protein
MEINTSGGFKDTDVKADTVSPNNSPESRALVTTVTALAKYRITSRRSMLMGGRGVFLISPVKIDGFDKSKELQPEISDCLQLM